MMVYFFYSMSPYMYSIGTIGVSFNFFQVSISCHKYIVSNITQSLTLQITAIMIKFNVKLPSFLSSFLNFLTFFAFNMNLTQPECQSNYFRKAQNRFLMVLFLPLFVFALLALGYYLTALYRKFYVRRAVKQNIRKIQSVCDVTRRYSDQPLTGKTSVEMTDRVPDQVVKSPSMYQIARGLEMQERMQSGRSQSFRIRQLAKHQVDSLTAVVFSQQTHFTPSRSKAKLDDPERTRVFWPSNRRGLGPFWTLSSLTRVSTMPQT